MIKKIKVGAYDYDINVTNELNHGDIECYGLCDKKRNTITLQEGMTETRLREVLLHEVMHACEESYGFSIPERSINTLALALTSVFKDNPKFGEIICGTPKRRRIRRKGKSK